MDELTEQLNKTTTHCPEEAHVILKQDAQFLENYLLMANISQLTLQSKGGIIYESNVLAKFEEINRMFQSRFHLNWEDYDGENQQVFIKEIKFSLDCYFSLIDTGEKLNITLKLYKYMLNGLDNELIVGYISK